MARVWAFVAYAVFSQPHLIQSKNHGDACADGGTFICAMGCFDDEDEACHPGLTEMQCNEIYGHTEWTRKCNCRCVKVICDWGCWDEAAHACQNITQQWCTSSTLNWAQHCQCRSDQGEILALAAEAKTGAVNLYFSIPAFVVLFRESLEVVIILVIIVQFLHKAEQDGTISKPMFLRFRNEVYLGAGLGFLVCIVLGVGFLALASFAYKLFSGDGEIIFEGVMMILTSLILTFLALNFYKMIYTKEAHERKMKKRILETVEASVNAEENSQGAFGKKHAFFILAFTTGLREGMESIIFLTGVVADVKDLSSLPIPIVTALILARVVGFFFFQGTKKIRVDWFMRGSALLLLFIAAGFFTSSMHNFQELDVFGTWSPKSERPWQNSKVWDATSCCNDKTNRFFVLVRALFGWQDQPTPLEFFAYAFYWTMVLTIGYFVTRHAKRQLEELVEKWKAEDEVKEANTCPKVALTSSSISSPDANPSDKVVESTENL